MSLQTHLTGPPAERPDVLPVSVWRFSVEQYHEMVRAGILTEDDPVELLDGLLVRKMTKNPPHRAVTGLVREALDGALPEGWYADSQEPITLSTSEPEPDGTVVRGTRRQYLDRHPGAGDVTLVVEVADASLERDQTFKKQIYAQAGIPVYWIVNLIDRRVEVYTDPSSPSEAPDYGQRRDYAAQDAVPLVLEGREVAQIPVGRLLP
jgi:Uma2 family endonuclease